MAGGGSAAPVQARRGSALHGGWKKGIGGPEDREGDRRLAQGSPHTAHPRVTGQEWGWPEAGRRWEVYFHPPWIPEGSRGGTTGGSGLGHRNGRWRRARGHLPRGVRSWDGIGGRKRPRDRAGCSEPRRDRRRDQRNSHSRAEPQGMGTCVLLPACPRVFSVCVGA